MNSNHFTSFIQTQYDKDMEVLSVYGFIYGFLLIASIFYFIFNKTKNIQLVQNYSNPLNKNLNSRMKMYEIYTEYNKSHVGEEPFIVRLKGRNFKLIKKSQDYNKSMIELSSELMREFHAHTSMVFDDEIILIFSSSLYHQFNGNCMKLQSIIASYASSSLTLKTNTMCSFYCSIVDFKVSDKLLSTELINYIKWRINRAKSIHSNIWFIKKTTELKYVKFGLSMSQYNENEYINLFTSPILDTNIKLKKMEQIN